MINQISSLNLVSPMQDPVTAKDGAGPVIVSVSKTQPSVTTHSQDQVTVTFSEPVQFTNAAINSGVPSLMFNVYNSNGTARDSLILAGISTLQTEQRKCGSVLYVK